MTIVATRKAQQNRAALDPWTVVHLGAGLAAGLMGFPARWALPLAAAYEVLEQYAERRRWGRKLFGSARPESLPNALTDVGVFAVGHRLGMSWRKGRRPL